MECNKEEAFRARDIAEKKMQNKEFSGARKFALKAQQLYPETENISRMICVCDVHCSAEKNMYGNLLDWYGILQVEQTADDSLIKKQYRKFALLLHPDKNKFPGAEAAFKLVGEAQRVLLDKENRSVYDMKRRAPYKPVMPKPPPQQANRSFSARVQNNFTSDSSSHTQASNPPFQQPKAQQGQSGAANGRQTFWTQCPFCSVRYQYYKEVLNRALRCQSCQKPFIAYDMYSQGSRPGVDATQPVFPRREVPVVGASKAGSEAINEKDASSAGSQAGQNARFSRPQNTRRSNKGSNEVGRKVNGKRGKKQMVESSESFESDTSSEGLEMQSDGDTGEQRFDGDGVSHTRRSSRNKRHVSYDENVIDDEVTMSPSKRAKGSRSSPLGEDKANVSEKEQLSNPSKLFKESGKGTCNKCDGDETVVESINKNLEADNGGTINSSPTMTPEPTFHEYPDPEFSNFDKDREEQCFKVGQLWAAYDTVDAMPRFYALIRRIFSPGFKLRITWLEPDPDDEVGREWAEEELPYSCGKFKYGNSENTEDRLMFSHMPFWEKGSGRNTVKIYPEVGETWAVFKNWDAKWFLIPENDRKFEYEFVEILSEYDETVGIRAAPLGKLKGFASLFCRRDENEVRIPPSELLRFSHKVPSRRMTGNERIDVPTGSFELDPASISMNLEEITLPKSDGKVFVNGLSSKVETTEKSASSYHVDEKDVDVNGYNIPDPEFYNFDGMKSIDKFQVNQVWALYSDTDGLPKYYGLIKKIDPHPDLKLHIAWLEACSSPTDMILWKTKMMPISCGQFKIKGAKLQTYTSNNSFSHQLRADLTERRNIFAIYPRKDEVWALYKDWNPDMTISDLENCDYDIVEVLEENNSHTKVLFLERLKGFNAVFKPLKKGNSSVTREIPRIELLRFSHQIPSFRLTDEKGGSLRGFWELDPAAFPAHFLYKLK